MEPIEKQNNISSSNILDNDVTNFDIGNNTKAIIDNIFSCGEMTVDNLITNSQAVSEQASTDVKCSQGHTCYHRDAAPLPGYCDTCPKKYDVGEEGTLKCDICNYIVCQSCSIKQLENRDENKLIDITFAAPK